MFHFGPSSSQRGIVLLVVLLFLQIMSILGLYSLSSSLLSEKMNAESWQKESTLLTLDELVQVITIKLQSEMPPCVIAQNQALNLLAKSLEGWQSPMACEGQFQQLQYYYVVEQLGEDDCAQLEGVDMSQFAAHYFRITVLTVIKKTHMKIILQTTVIRPFNRIRQCDKEGYAVNRGQQTWREL